MSQWMAFDSYYTAGLLRGMADMSAGVLCAAVLLPLMRKMKKKRVVAAGVLVPCIFMIIVLNVVAAALFFQDKMNQRINMCEKGEEEVLESGSAKT